MINWCPLLTSDLIDAYVADKIYEKIDEEFPSLNPVARDEELDSWKDLLYELVVVESDNRALTSLRTEGYLRDQAKNYGCKVKFDRMMAFLSNEDQRILREPQPLVDVKTKQASNYYSLGHDAIAIALSKWRTTRKLVLEKRNIVKNGVHYTMRGIAALTALSAISLGFIILIFSKDERVVAVIIMLSYFVIAAIFWLGAKPLSKFVLQVVVRSRLFRRLLSPGQKKR